MLDFICIYIKLSKFSDADFEEDRFSLVPLLQSTCRTRVLTRVFSSLKYVEMIMNYLIIVLGLC